MHTHIEANVAALKALFKPSDDYRTRLAHLSIIESERYSDVSVHATGVLNVAMQIADSLGCSEEQRAAISFGVRWHDIGKLAVPHEVFRKPGGLDNDEWAMMKQHTDAGLALVGEDAPETLKNIIKYHHEAYNGRGYNQLKGEDIPLEARICQVADVYDALCQRRDYKQSMSESEVLMLMTEDNHPPAQGRRNHDPFILRRFVELKLRDPNLNVTDDRRAYLEAFSKSDPMSDLGFDPSANGGWTVMRTGHRALNQKDEVTGNRRLVELRSPSGETLRRIDRPVLEIDSGYDENGPISVRM